MDMEPKVEPIIKMKETTEPKFERSNTLKKIVTGIMAILQAIFRACGKKDKGKNPKVELETAHL